MWTGNEHIDTIPFMPKELIPFSPADTYLAEEVVDGYAERAKLPLNSSGDILEAGAFPALRTIDGDIAELAGFEPEEMLTAGIVQKLAESLPKGHVLPHPALYVRRGPAGILIASASCSNNEDFDWWANAVGYQVDVVHKLPNNHYRRVTTTGSVLTNEAGARELESNRKLHDYHDPPFAALLQRLGHITTADRFGRPEYYAILDSRRA